jgi:nucleotide-binding universal stress UspA family protein
LRPLFAHVAQIPVPATAAALPAGTAWPPPAGEAFFQAERHAVDEGLEFLAKAGVVPDDARVAVGFPGPELKELASQNRAEAVVVGSPPRGALRLAVTGSVALALAHDGDRPLVVARPGGHPHIGAGPLVCGVDPADGTAARVVHAAARFATMLNRALVLVHAGDFRNDAASRLSYETLLHSSRRRALRTLHPVLETLPDGLEVEVVLADGDPVDRIEAVAEERAAALVAVGCRGRGALRTMLSGSVSRALSRSSRRAVMVVPPALA